jgi:hypothetical protein
MLGNGFVCQFCCVLTKQNKCQKENANTLCSTFATQNMSFASERWGGTVPVVFRLAQAEIATHEAPPPLFMLLPRHSYLPMIAAEVGCFSEGFLV